MFRLMSWLLRWIADLLVLVVAALAAPWWLWRLARRGKLRTDWRGRLGFGSPVQASNGTEPRRRLLIHAVSVGEVNAIRGLVTALAEGPSPIDVVVASTTNTGFARAQALFGAHHPVVRYPFDFNFGVRRFLARVRPDAVALVELEVWPTFVAECGRREIPVCVVNGRLTERSARGYDRIRWLIRSAFSALTHVSAQTPAYAERFARLGVPADRIEVNGTMKWDSAPVTDEVAGAVDLAKALGIDRNRLLVVAGSTAPEEHAMLHDATPAGVQLLCAPRRPEWFDQAARDLPGCVRRTDGALRAGADRFLLDTIGELRAAYALADVVVIGRSFGARHGSDMMEPVALGKPTVVGPAVGDFEATVDALRAGNGIVQVTREALPETIAQLLDDPERRAALVRAGRAVIAREQGTTERTAQRLLDVIREQRHPTTPKSSPPRREAEAAKEEKEERRTAMRGR